MAKEVTRSRFASRNYDYNPAIDLQQVDQFGFVNLASAFEKGIIPSSIEEKEVSYNNVVNPGTLISHAQDVFDGVRKAEYVRSQLAILETKREREAAEKAAAAASAAAGVPGSSTE